jgi:hypothetical protein
MRKNENLGSSDNGKQKGNHCDHNKDMYQAPGTPGKEAQKPAYDADYRYDIQ